MAFPLFVIVLYSLPIISVLLAIRWVLKKEGKIRKAQRFTKFSFLGLIICIISFTIYDWVSRRHVHEFALGENFLIELIATEQHGYLDTPVDIWIQIEEKQTQKLAEFELKFGVGSALDFSIYQNFPSLIILNGRHENAGYNSVIDMTDGAISTDVSMEKFEYQKTVDRIGLNSNCQLIEY